MKKINLKNNIKSINRMATTMPKSINEAINFESDNMDMMFDEPMEEPMDNAPEKEIPSDNGGMDVMQFVDDIRKKSLKGMAELAENPDDERYQLLKKIWQICDKKPDQQTAFGTHQQQKPM